MSRADEKLDGFVLEPRKEQKKAPLSLPKEFLTKCAALFADQFKEESGGITFTAHGNLYADEVILCLCAQELNRPVAFSFYTSVDLKPTVAQKPEQVTLILKSMVDLMASWVSQTYENSNESGLDPLIEAIDELSPDWQPADWDGRKVFVKLNRDNLLLEKATDQFLKDNGFDS